ncbi:MAG: InlB B-repeat-containing protein [Paludibacteraceae bacterium]|nr:InlB B-repeat-containing protein [Paludibacteraceae bacterium]
MFIISDSKTDGKWDGTWDKYAPNPVILGDFNDWDPDQGTLDGSNRLIVDLEASTNYEFKVLVGDGSVLANWYGLNSGNITNTTSSWWLFYSKQDNCTVTSGEAGEYCFHWDNSSKYIGVYYPQARLEKDKYIYFDARDNSTWTASNFDARFWFKYYDSDSNYPDDLTDYTCTKANAKDSWVYPYVVPNSDYIGQVQLNRYVSGSWNADADKIAAHTRTSSKQNCIKLASGSGATSWTTYCPPMSSASLSDNSTSLVSWQTGDGTSGNPYLISKSGTIKVSASATKAVPDENMTPNYNFKVSDNGASASSAQSGTGSTYDKGSLSANHTYEFSLEAWNAYNNTTGTKHTTATHLWYKAVQLRNVTHTLSGVTKSAGRVGENQAADNEPYTATFAASTGYDLPATITVKFGSTTKTAGTDYTWNSSTGDVSIPASKINGNVTITVTGVAKTTTVTLNANTENHGSGDNQSVTATYGADLPSFTHTTAATGYHLVGYYTGKTDGTKIIDENGNFTANSGIWNRLDGATLTLYAHYEPSTYTVTFVSNNDAYGTVDVSEITGVTHGSTVSIASNVLTLDGTDVTATKETDGDCYTYAFSSWSVSDGDAITDDTEITATFTATGITYDITYNLNSGDWVSSAKEAAAPAEYTCGVGATLPDDTYVKRDGHTFLGWVSQWDLDNTAPPYTPISVVDDEAYGNVEYVAQWESSSYHVTYAGNGNTGGTVPTNSTDYDGGETVTVAGNTGSLIKTGYTFRGWSDGTTFFLGGQSFEMPAANVTLTAVWEPNSIPAETLFSADFTESKWSSVSFNQGSTTTADVHYGITFYSKSDSKQFSISSSRLLWPASNISSNNYFLAIPVSNVNGSVTVTVTMDAVTKKSANVSYVVKDGETSVSSPGASGTRAEGTAGEGTVSFTVNLSNANKKAVVYLGRYNGNAENTNIKSITITTPGADGHFDVSFKDGETAPASHTTWPSDIVGVEDGLKILAPSTTPSATGYTYGGWYTNAKCTLAVNYGTMTITADTKIYAKWTAKTTSVTLDANTANHGSTGSSVTATYDSALPSFSPATPSGAYVLEGYYTTASGEGVKIINADGTLVSETTSYTADGLWKSVESSLTLYARYVTAYSVTYNKNGATSGTAPSDATYYAGGSTVTAKDTTGCKFVYAGHVFRGWNTADNGSGTYYAPGDKFTISGNTTLYAVWVAGTAGTVTYNLKTNSSSTTLDDCTSATPTSGDLTASTTINTYGDADAVAEASAKSSETQKLKIDAEYTAANYYEWTCAVASGKTFIPSQVVMKFQAVSGLTQYKVVLTDGTTSYDSAFVQTTSAGGTLETLTWNIAEGNAFAGGSTMKLRLWAYKKESKATAFRLGSPITIKGIIKPETYTITYKDKGDVDFSGSHADSPSAHPTSHTYGAATTLNSATKVGYTFGGWFDNADCDGDAVTILGATAVTSNVTLYAKWNPVTLTFTGNGSGVKWDWKDATNWTPACVPTIEHDVIIQKPVEVSMYGAGNIAKAKSIVIDKYNGATGKLTIDGRFGLVVAETIQMKNEEGNLVAPTSADLHIESTSDYQNGALAVKGFTEASGKDINATVIFYTRSRLYGWSSGEYTGFYMNQFIGTPLRNPSVYDYYGCWMYKWDPTADEGRGDWKNEYTSMVPFQGYDILNEYPSSPSFWLTGALVYSEDQELVSTYTGADDVNGSENMFANSWMAPIDVTQFETTDFAGGDGTKMEATLYVFNSGTTTQYDKLEDNEGTDPGQFLVMTPNSSSYTGGISEIQSMQAFSVYAKADGATLTLDYDRLVYQPLLNRSTEIQAMRAPRRAKAESELDDPEIMRIRVEGEQSADKIHLLIRDDFSEGFDNGWDASKMFGMSFAPQLYVMTETGKKLSINCTPEAEGTVLGFRKGETDSVYTFSFEYDGAEEFYLNDLKEQTSTLISVESTYEFTAEADDAEARFIISATPIHKTATGVDQTSGNTQDAKVRKVIINDHVYIIRGGRMYSVEGTMLK